MWYNIHDNNDELTIGRTRDDWTNGWCLRIVLYVKASPRREAVSDLTSLAPMHHSFVTFFPTLTDSVPCTFQSFNFGCLAEANIQTVHMNSSLHIEDKRLGIWEGTCSRAAIERQYRKATKNGVTSDTIVSISIE